jgi:hypothetical protein
MIMRCTIAGGTTAALALLSALSFRPWNPVGDGKPWKLAAPAPVVALKPPKLELPAGGAKPESCGECHADIHDEWVSTAHAIAWVDEVYREEVKDKTRPESCHGCHTPSPILAGGLVARAEARPDDRDLGISCGACHLGPDGAMLGPWGATTTAHKSAKSESMTEKASSRMCAVCHATNIGPVVGIAKDFLGAKLEEQGVSCIGCHMAPFDRKPSKGAEAGATNRPGRSHAIQTPRDPAFLALAFETSARVDAGKTLVKIQNRAGHRVPGLIGRRVEFQIEVLGADGKAVGQGGVTFDARSYLPYDKSVEVPVAAVGTSVRLRGLHHDPRRDEPVEFLDVRLEPSGR